MSFLKPEIGSSGSYAFSDSAYTLIGPLPASPDRAPFVIESVSADATIMQGGSDIKTIADADDSEALPLESTVVGGRELDIFYAQTGRTDYLAVKSVSGAASIVIRNLTIGRSMP